jgi:uncharacterized Zn finger protein
MFITTYHECKKCGHEIEVEIEVNETDGDLPETCPECGHPTDGSDVAADAMGSAIDNATEASK